MTPDINVLVTGGAGFIGSHLVDALLERPSTTVTVLDRLSTGGSRANLEAARRRSPPAVRPRRRRRCRPGRTDRSPMPDSVIHAAAESHVDRSIDDPGEFLRTNVSGTQAVLEATRAHDVRMLMLSTDEVYGPGRPDDSVFDEDARACSPPARTRRAKRRPICSAARTS